MARGQGTEIWAEQIIEIADDTTSDYRIDKDDNRIFRSENVYRARLQIEARKWIMARLDPRLWGNCPEIRVKYGWSPVLSVEEREKALELIGIAKSTQPKVIELPP